jgi:hypothetical protein
VVRIRRGLTCGDACLPLIWVSAPLSQYPVRSPRAQAQLAVLTGALGTGYPTSSLAETSPFRTPYLRTLICAEVVGLGNEGGLDRDLNHFA